MRSQLLILSLLMIFSGCDKKESQADHDARIAQEARAQLLSELKAKEEAEAKAKSEQHSTLSQMGFLKEGNIITIDTNKTQQYFEKMGKHFSAQMEEMTQEMQKGYFTHKESGIDVNQSHIEIDLNKTEHFLDKWSKKMQDFAQEFDAMSKELTDETSK